MPDTSNKKGFCYIMSDESYPGFYKIGMSKNPKKREKTLLHDAPTITLFKILETDRMRATEKYIHKALEKNRVRGEWFKLTHNELETIIDLFGFTDFIESNKVNSKKSIINTQKEEGLRAKRDEKDRVKRAKRAYGALMDRIIRNNCTVGKTLSEEKFIDGYKKEYYNVSFDFKLSLIMLNKRVVEYEDVLAVNKWVTSFIDKPWHGFRLQSDKIPTGMVHLYTSPKSYGPVNCFENGLQKKCDNIYDAIVFKVEDIRRLLIGRLNREYKIEEKTRLKIIDFVKECTMDDIIKLKYVDYEKIINFKNKIVEKNS